MAGVGAESRPYTGGPRRRLSGKTCMFFPAGKNGPPPWAQPVLGSGRSRHKTHFVIDFGPEPPWRAPPHRRSIRPCTWGLPPPEGVLLAAGRVMADAGRAVSPRRPVSKGACPVVFLGRAGRRRVRGSQGLQVSFFIPLRTPQFGRTVARPPVRPRPLPVGGCYRRVVGSRAAGPPPAGAIGGRGGGIRPLLQ